MNKTLTASTTNLTATIFTAMRNCKPKQQHPMAADWSQLPRELLQLISQKLNSELYLIRSRSVCSWWRSSIPNYYQNYLPVKFGQGQLFFQLYGSKTNIDSISYLVKHDIFLIKPPKRQPTLHSRPWLMRIGPDFDGKTKLWNPLSFNQPLSSHLVTVLDFNKHSIHLRRQMFYIYHCTLLRQNRHDYFLRPCVTTCQGEQPLVFLTTDLYGNPIMFRSGTYNSSKTVPNMSTSHGRNVCVFKGRPCMVDKTGRTVMIGSDLSYHFIAEPEPVLGGESKFLVETSDFQLLLVDCYKSNSDIVWIDVFRLNEKEKKWVKLTNLGGRVLFLGNNGCSFSASALDLGFANGNCVIYNFGCLNLTMGVFDLDQGRVLSLSDYPDYYKLFWPSQSGSPS